jgi:hypothetical protein
MHHSGSVEDAIERVTWWLKARKEDRNADPNLVHTYWNERVCEDPCPLLVSDLELLAEVAWMYDDLTR